MQRYSEWLIIRESNDLPTHNRKVMVLMRGLPGAGKSSVVGKMLTKYGGDLGHVFSIDHEFAPEFRAKQLSGIDINPDEEYEEYIRNYDDNKKGVYVRAQIDKVKKAVDQGITPIIIDNTNVRAQYMRSFADHAEKNGYEIIIQYPNSPWWKKYSSYLHTKEDKEQLDQFAKELAARNKHGVPYDAIRKMIDNWEDRPTMTDILGRDPTPKYKKPK